jgi:hypothetical protein
LLQSRNRQIAAERTDRRQCRTGHHPACGGEDRLSAREFLGPAPAGFFASCSSLTWSTSPPRVGGSIRSFSTPAGSTRDTGRWFDDERTYGQHLTVIRGALVISGGMVEPKVFEA